MHVVVGVFIALFGLLFVVLSRRFSRGSAASSREIFGRQQGPGMRAWNRVVFTVVGSVIALAGLAYAIGVAG
jgi:hypothetical protein